ncbi:MAG: cysteine dioxygenase, partial [Bryobacteraceae bacterium]
GRCRFQARPRMHASVGEAGCLIPPFEHHVLENAREDPSITLHIYGGEISQCNVYVPRPDGWYDRQVRELQYDD